MSTPTDALLETEIVGRTIYGEGRGEPWEGLIGIGWTIRNRVLQPSWWGTTWIDVCRKPYQYSCWNEGDPNRVKLQAATLQQAGYRRCYAAALLVYDGNVADPTGGATHYFAVGLVPPPQWVAEMDQTASIGRHLFFKERNV